ncbi:hypothetical protein NC651_039611 [Populus alba x Populus x berolinensis]|nr:hypothetical protein NC651_039611 [Populus alba x Populus x berolinensis]
MGVRASLRVPRLVLMGSEVNNHMRAERQLLPPIELTLKQMDTSGTELECFQALQRQEQLAASHRINGLWEEVQKQKELEQTMQRRYGDLNRALELAEAATKQAAILNSEPVTPDEHGNSMPVGSSDKKVLEEQMDVDSEKVHGALVMDTSLTNNLPSVEGQMTHVQGNGHEASVEIKVNDASADGDAGDVMSTEIMDGLASFEGESIQERADDFDKPDMMQVSSGGDDKVNQMKDEGKVPVIDLTNSD